jgi:hypothetical protein
MIQRRRELHKPRNDFFVKGLQIKVFCLHVSDFERGLKAENHVKSEYKSNGYQYISEGLIFFQKHSVIRKIYLFLQIKTGH